MYSGQDCEHYLSMNFKYEKNKNYDDIHPIVTTCSGQDCEYD